MAIGEGEDSEVEPCTDDEQNQPRGEPIRAAVRMIRSGTREIDEVFASARGPLSKGQIKDIRQRVKELRATAEWAEDAFRDWTVDLSGGGFNVRVERDQHDALRASFEAEVAAIQRSMVRLAEEVKRRQACKDKEKDAPLEYEDSAFPEETKETAVREEPQASSIPSDSRPTTAELVAADSRQSVASRSEPYRPPPCVAEPSRSAPQRSSTPYVEAKMSSHSALSNTLQNIADVEAQVRGNFKQGKGQINMRERIATFPNHMKYLLGIVVISLGYLIWSHARMLVLATDTLHVENVHTLPGGAQFGSTGNGVTISAASAAAVAANAQDGGSDDDFDTTVKPWRRWDDQDKEDEDDVMDAVINSQPIPEHAPPRRIR